MQALSHQEKAVMSSERLHGIDHPQTIQDYVSFVTFSLIYRQSCYVICVVFHPNDLQSTHLIKIYI